MKSDLLKDVEYYHIVKNNHTLLTLDVNGKTKAEVQALIGNELGEGSYIYSMKLKGQSRNKTGKIRAFITNPDKKQVFNNMDDKRIDAIEKTINELHASINKNSAPGFDMLLNMKDESYKMQIEFYKMQIETLRTTISEQKETIKDFEREGEKGGFDIGQLLKFAPLLLNSKAGGLVKGLKDFTGLNNEDETGLVNDPGEINPKIANLLNRLDLSKLNDAQIDNFIKMGTPYLRQMGLLKEEITN